MKIPFRMILNTLLVFLIFIGLQLYIGWNMYLFLSYYVSEISIFVLGIFLTVVCDRTDQVAWTDRALHKSDRFVLFCTA